jgi:ABC-type phosphate/phosphonate transport system substrate-binding protein
MIANLMMYRRPELTEAHNHYWALIRKNLTDAGIDSPETLSQDADMFTVWNDPELVMSQTCGMPYRTQLHENVKLIGTPDFGVIDSPAGYYRSALVVRADDPRTDIAAFKNAVFAYNQTHSQSGYAAPYSHVKPLGFWFENQLETGQHLKSAQAVALGTADIASLDAVTWRLLETYEAFAADLRVLEWTQPTPGLPLITAMGNDADAIFIAVKGAIEALSPEDKALLGLKGIVKIAKEDYMKVPNPE